MSEKPRTVFDILGDGIVAIGDGIKTGAVETVKFVRENWKPIVAVIVTVGVGIVTAVLINGINEDNNDDNDDGKEGDDNGMKMPKDIYDRLKFYWDPVKADEWAQLMEKGEITLDEAKAQADGWEKYSAEIAGRRDISPSEWQDFEDGWRPESR